VSFRTTCPKCKKEGELYVTSGEFYATGMRLAADGFAFQEARHMDTDSEWVECHACGAGFQLAEFVVP
jgi:hypothetical protein